MKKLKLIASYVRLITCLLLHRNFGKTQVFYFKDESLQAHKMLFSLS